MKITQKVKDSFENKKYLEFGTASKDGIPNVVVIGAQKILNDNTICIIDTFFGKTQKNILENSNVSICIECGYESYQIKGEASYLTEGNFFEEAKKWILEKRPDKIVKGVVKVNVKEIYDLKPTYETAGKKIT